MTIGAQFATLAYVETMRRNLMRAISGAGIAQHAPDVDGGAAENFIELADCPQTYSGAAGEVPSVNAAEGGLEFNPYLTLSPTAPTVIVRNLTDGAVDPMIQFAVDATPVVKWTVGIARDAFVSYADVFAIGAATSLDDSTDFMLCLDYANDESNVHINTLTIGGYSAGLLLEANSGDSTSRVTLNGLTILFGCDDGPSDSITLNADSINLDAPLINIMAVGELLFWDSEAGAYAGLVAPTIVSSSYVLSLPDADAEGFLKSDGAGALSFTSVVVDSDFANTPDSGDADTDALIDKIRDALITHGLIASSSGPS